MKRKQKWVTFRGTKRDAQARLAELLNDQNKGTFVEPHKRTLGEWMTDWLEQTIQPTRTPRTYDTYKGVLANHLIPALGALRLQDVKPMHLEKYYADHRTKLAPATLEQHHMILHGAFEAALRNGVVPRNVAKLVNGKPHAAHGHAEAVTEHCWTADEAKAFLNAAKGAGNQPAAFYSLALETGMRKSELGGLKWTDIDLGSGTVKIQRQLVVRTGHPFAFGPVKNKRPRVVRVTTETNALLRRHRAHQAEIKLQSGGRYHDNGLVFAKEWGDVQRSEHTLGDPLGLNNIGQREFARVIKLAGVRRIKFHGMRHTSATLALECGVSAKVVQERLGHQKIATTLDIYAHVLPAMDQAAADLIGAVIHG